MHGGNEHPTSGVFDPPIISAWKPWLASISAATVFLVVSFITMQQIGLFDVPDNDAGAKSLAAAIALVGTLMASATTLVGTILKFALDDRTARTAAVESARNYALAVDAEQRNRIQAALTAVALLGENDVTASPGRTNSAVLALSSLGELDLAVALVRDLWPSGVIRYDVADVVLSKCFREGTEATAKAAAMVVYENATSIGQGDQHIWPLEPDWRSELPLSARLGLVGAAVDWLVHSLTSEPDRTPSAPVAVLYHALADDDPMVRGVVSAALVPFVEAIPDWYWAGTSNGGVITASELRSRLGDLAGEVVQTRLSHNAGMVISPAIVANRSLKWATPTG